MTFEEVLSLARKYDDRICEFVELSKVENPAGLVLDGPDMGYTLKTLAIALWCFWHVRDFKEGLLTTVNLGGDADTNAATACAVLGAKFGFSAIPKTYVTGLRNKEVLEELFLH